MTLTFAERAASNMALKYYYDLMSQPCRAVYMFLKLNKVPYEDVRTDVRKGKNQTEEYAKVNPFKVVPALKDDQFCLTESIAMVEYIIKTRNLSDHWYPTDDPKKRARISEYLHWQHANTRLHCSHMFQNLLIIPRATGKPVDQDKVAKGRERVKNVVHHLETYFLRDTPYLHSKELTIADLFGVCEVMQLYPVLEEGLYENSPTVKAWVQLVQQQTNPTFDEAHKVVYMVREMYKSMTKA